MFTLSTARALHASNVYEQVYVVSVSGADATEIYALLVMLHLYSLITGNFSSTELTELQNNVTRELSTLILPVSK